MLKRPLVFGTVLFSLGILLAVYNINISIIFTAALAVLSLFAVFFFRNTAASLCALAVLTVLLGMMRMNIAQIGRADIISSFSGRTFKGEMTVTEFSEDNSAVVSFREGNTSYKVYLTVKSDVQLYPGDLVRGEITLRAPIDSKTSVSDFSSYLASRGVHLLASAEEIETAGRQTKGLMGKIYSLRVYMDSVGEKYFSGDSRALFNAMVFGDKRLISKELSAALQASGLNHIAVVSGMHLSVIIALQMFLTQKIFGKRRIGYLIAALAAVFITLVTGAGASVVRALIMCLVFQAAQLLYRENDILTSLSLSGFAMMAVNPYIVFNAGFILSILSVLGIVLYNDKIWCAFRKFMPKRAAEGASVSVSAQLAVTPALVYYFGIVTPYALISNILVLAVSTGYVIVGMALLLVSNIPVLSLLIEGIMKLMSLAMESTCFEIASFPGALLDFSNAGIGFMLSWVFIMVLIYIYPVGLKTFYRTAAVFALAAAVVICFSEENKIDMQFLPYGEKTMTAAEFSQGSPVLIDCPDIYDAKMLEDSLRPFEYAVLTTGDEDEVLAQASNISTIIASKELFDEEERKKLSQQARSMNVRVIFAEDSMKVSAGDAVVEYIPVEGIEGRAVKIEYDTESVVTLQGLSAADIERMIDSGVRFSCNYLKLPSLAAVAEGSDLTALCTGKVAAEARLEIR